MRNCEAGRARQRYSQLSLPLSAVLADALQRHHENSSVNELTAPPSQDATDEACQGAWHE
jgi:hypothetical protein